jgi:predicted outer membrane lipoprotein
MEVKLLLMPLALIGVVVFGLTEGLKRRLPALADSWLGVAVRAVPVLLGMAFGVVPGVFPADVPPGLCLLLGGAAGVFCAFIYELVTNALKRKAEAHLGGR